MDISFPFAFCCDPFSVFLPTARTCISASHSFKDTLCAALSAIAAVSLIPPSLEVSTRNLQEYF